MLIPAGPENVTLRRTPLVSFSIMGISLLFYLIYLFVPLPSVAPLQAAIFYRLNHPYLVASQRLDDLIAANNSYAYKIVDRPENEAKVAEEQRMLEAMEKEAFRTVDSMPHVRFGYRPAMPNLFSLIAHIFFHPSSLYLIGTFIFFYLTAPFIEDRWGRVCFPIFFISGGVVGALGLTVRYPQSFAAIYGASSAVAAVMGAFTVRYYNTRIKFIYMVQILKRETFASPLIFFPLWMGAQLIISLAWNDALGYRYLSFWGQLDAFLFGVLVAGIIKVFHLESKLYQSPFDKLPEETRFAISIPQKIEKGEVDEAFALSREASRKYPNNHEFSELYWDQAVRLGRTKEAVTAGKKLIVNHLEEGQYERAFFHWGELTRNHPGENVAYSHMETMIHGLTSMTHHRDAEIVLRYALKHAPRDLEPSLMAQLLETARFMDPKMALENIEQLSSEQRLSGVALEVATSLRQELLQLYSAEDLSRDPLGEPEAIELSPMPLQTHGEEEYPFITTRINKLVVYTGRLLHWDDSVFQAQLESINEAKRLNYTQLKAIAAAAIRPLGDKAHLLIDLHIHDPYQSEARHVVIRLSSRTMALKQLVPQIEASGEAVRALLSRLLAKSNAKPFPDRDALLGKRFATFQSREAFELEVYGVVS